MAEHVEVMVAAVLISMIVMYIASGTIAHFIQEHPTTKMLALSFLFMIGTALIADGLGFHIPRGLYLLRHGFFRACGDVQRVCQKAAQKERAQRNPKS